MAGRIYHGRMSEPPFEGRASGALAQAQVDVRALRRRIWQKRRSSIRGTGAAPFALVRDRAFGAQDELPGNHARARRRELQLKPNPPMLRGGRGCARARLERTGAPYTCG